MYHRSETEEKRGKEKPLEHIESGRSYMKYAIIGAGGCGGSIGAFLAEAGQDVTLIARGEHLAAIREHGICVESPSRTFTVTDIKAVDEAGYAEIPDVLFVCVKGYSIPYISPFLREHSDAETLIVPILNIYGTGADPDAISSAFGLKRYLEYYGITSTICYVGSIDRFNTRKMMDTFGIEIYSYDDIPDMQAEDYIVHVDCQKPNANTTDLLGNEVACVDHHPVFVKTEDYKFEDIRIVGACASIVASYFQTSGVPMDEDVATALAYGIKMDTADFVRGTTAFDMDMMAYLFDYISTEKLNSMYNSTIEFQDLKAYGAAIEHIEVFDYVGFTYIPFECPNSLVAIISDFILSLDVVDVAVVYSINSDGIKFSVRSERADVDAGKLIYQALDGIGSGGGHAAMAGGFVSHEALNKIGRDYDRKLKELFMKTIRKNRGV